MLIKMFVTWLNNDDDWAFGAVSEMTWLQGAEGQRIYNFLLSSRNPISK